MERREFISSAGSIVLGCMAFEAHGEPRQMYGLITNMTAVAGRRDDLVAILIQSVSSMPGCLNYIVAKDAKDENAIWITEVWESKERHDASLTLPSVAKAIAAAKPLIAVFGSQVITTPVGGYGLPATSAEHGD